jgi:DDE superfamily endonuclease
VVDGGYSKRPFLRQAKQEEVVVVGRLAKNAALWSLPLEPPPGRPGPKPTYGKQRLVLHLRAGQRRGWEQVECVQYRKRVSKTVKTFLATWKPAGGLIRVVLVHEEDGWRAYFCTKAEASVAEILEAVADRGALEETNKDVKEIWGADQQQVRNLYANVGCFNLNGWMYSAVEAWAWERSDEELVDRSGSPWDDATRRPSHADKRKALQREALRAEIQGLLAGHAEEAELQAWAERVLRLAG